MKKHSTDIRKAHAVLKQRVINILNSLILNNDSKPIKMKDGLSLFPSEKQLTPKADYINDDGVVFHDKTLIEYNDLTLDQLLKVLEHIEEHTLKLK